MIKKNNEKLVKHTFLKVGICFGLVITFVSFSQNTGVLGQTGKGQIRKKSTKSNSKTSKKAVKKTSRKNSRTVKKSSNNPRKKNRKRKISKSSSKKSGKPRGQRTKKRNSINHRSQNPSAQKTKRPLPPNVHRSSNGKIVPDFGYKFANKKPNDYRVVPAVAARFNRVWFEHNHRQKSKYGRLKKYGLSIHLKFDIRNLKGNQCVAIAFFYWKNGGKLLDFNKKYRAKDGQVFTWKEFTPTYSYSTFNDLELFIPYNELHIEDGKRHNLKFYATLSCEHSGQLTESNFKEFDVCVGCN